MFFNNVLHFAHGLTTKTDGHKGQKRLKYWTALGLLRGVMSSPASGVMMLRNRMKNILSEAPKHSLYDFELSIGDPTKYENSYMVPIHITGVPNQNYSNIYSNLINVLREVAFEVVKLSGNSKITGPLGKILIPNESKKSPLKIVLDGNPDNFFS